MDTEREIHSINGEAIAIQSIVLGLCKGLVQTGDVGQAIVANAFSYADAVAEAGAMKMGKDAPTAHTEAFMNTVEQLRRAALGSHRQPKGSI